MSIDILYTLSGISKSVLRTGLLSVGMWLRDRTIYTGGTSWVRNYIGQRRSLGCTKF